MKRWQCIICGFIYDEEKGIPEDGIPEGQDGTISPMIGCVQIAVLAKKILKCMRYRSLAAD